MLFNVFFQNFPLPTHLTDAVVGEVEVGESIGVPQILGGHRFEAITAQIQQLQMVLDLLERASGRQITFFSTFFLKNISKVMYEFASIEVNKLTKLV